MTVGAVEYERFFRQLVDVGRVDAFLAVSAETWAKVVDDDEKDVLFLICCLACCKEGELEADEEMESHRRSCFHHVSFMLARRDALVDAFGQEC